MSRKSVTKALGKLLKTKVNCDVIIYVGEKPDYREFHVNSKVLRSKSDYFKKVLSAKDIEKKDGNYVIRKPTVTPQVFDVIFK
jgi:hypothetical protein